MKLPEQPDGLGGMSADALERLLAAVSTGDEPAPEFASLYAVLRSASAPAEPGAQPGESAALAAFAEMVPVRRVRRSPAQWVTETRTRIAVAAGASLLVLSGGVAAAATGTLPGPAQGAAHDVLGVIGVHVPKSDDGASGSNGNGTSDTAPGQTGAHPTPRPSGSTGKPAHPVHPSKPAHPAHPAHPVHPSPTPHSTHAAAHPASTRPAPLPTLHLHAHTRGN
ncbi:MAG: hypothetical protein QOC82_435 [Frankiaceae bacterium]|nr:hypothetical protein [Frankiaceae bacterium]